MFATVALSCGESELVAGVIDYVKLQGCSRQWKFVRQTIVVSGNAAEPSHMIGTDSTAATTAIFNLSLLQHYVSEPHFKLTKVGTKDMVADSLTKVITINIKPHTSLWTSSTLTSVLTSQ